MVKTFCNLCNRNFKDESGLAMHNSAKHNASATIPTKKKKPFILIGIALVLAVAIYFIFVQSGQSSNTIGKSIQDSNSNFDSDSNLVQKINIGFGRGYTPNMITVKANQPVEITLDNSVKGCYRSFSIPQFGVSKYSSNPNDKIVFTPTQKGSFQFRCSMGMARGTLIVE